MAVAAAGSHVLACGRHVADLVARFGDVVAINLVRMELSTV